MIQCSAHMGIATLILASNFWMCLYVNRVWSKSYCRQGKDSHCFESDPKSVWKLEEICNSFHFSNNLKPEGLLNIRTQHRHRWWLPCWNCSYQPFQHYSVLKPFRNKVKLLLNSVGKGSILTPNHTSTIVFLNDTISLKINCQPMKTTSELLSANCKQV